MPTIRNICYSLAALLLITTGLAAQEYEHKSLATLPEGVRLDDASQVSGGRGHSTLLKLNRFGGQIVFLEDRSFHITVARVIRATDQELIATIGGLETRVPANDILRVFVRGGDSLKNGALLGVLVGVPGGMVGCEGASARCSVAGSLAVSIAALSGFGAWVDSLRVGRTVIYEAP